MSRAQDAQERPTYRIAVGLQQDRKVFALQTLPSCEAPFDLVGGHFWATRSPGAGLPLYPQ